MKGSKDVKVTNKSIKRMIPLENRDLEISLPCISYFGCSNCDWRGTSLCSYGIGKITGDKKLSELKKYGVSPICDKRVNILKLSYTGKARIPTLKQLQRDYRNFRLERQFEDHSNRYYKLKDKIHEWENWLVLNGSDITKEDELKELKKELDTVNMQLQGLGVDMGKLDQREYDRDSREKIEEKRTYLSGPELHRIMSLKPIDAEFKEEGQDE